MTIPTEHPDNEGAYRQAHTNAHNGVQLITDLLAEGHTPLDAWTICANRIHNNMIAFPPMISTGFLINIIAALQLHIAQTNQKEQPHP